MDQKAKKSPLYLAGKVDLQSFFAEEQGAEQSLHGLLRELNPGPLAPEARIMPLDQAASCKSFVLSVECNVRPEHEEDFPQLVSS